MQNISLIPLIAAALIAPGYIVSFISSRFTIARPNFSAGLALSSVYYALVYLVLGLLCSIKSPKQITGYIEEISYIHVFLIVVVGPIIVGTVAGYIIQREWIYKIIRWPRWPNFLQLYPASGIPSAWDWKFLNAGNQRIIVYLKDKSEILAFYDAGCFVSTDPNERDIYLSNIQEWRNGEDGEIIDTCDIEGILLTGDSIRKIVFYLT